MRILISGSLIVASLLATASSTFARETIIIRYTRYTCPSRCIVNMGPIGISVRDALGGKVTTSQIYNPRL